MLAADLQIHKIGINKVKKKLPSYTKIFRSEKSSLMINISKNHK
jgi:hypothetical protein